jgi:hypothetical protein
VDQIFCKSCGGAIDLLPGVFEYVCPYCETVNYIVDPGKPKDELPAAPEAMILIRTSQAAFHNFLLSVMVGDEDSPDDLVGKSEIGEERLLYVPCWFTAGSVVADWTASFGYDRQEPYTDYVSYTDSKGRSRTRPVTRYRTVTDWRPASGRASGKFRTQAYAGPPLPPGVEDGLNDLRGDPVAYAPAMVTGCEVLPFAKGLEAVRPVLRSQVSDRIRSIVLGYGQGDHQRDWSYDPHITVDYESPGLLPLARAAFRYRGQRYTVYANALDLRLLYRDPFPVDHRRKQKVARAYIPFYITLAYSAALFAYFQVANRSSGDYNAIAMAIGLACPLIFGFLRSAAVKSYSKGVRAAALALKSMNENAQLKSQEEIQRLRLQSQAPPMPLFARDGSDNILLPLLTLAWIAISAIGVVFYLFG